MPSWTLPFPRAQPGPPHLSACCLPTPRPLKPAPPAIRWSLTAMHSVTARTFHTPPAVRTLLSISPASIPCNSTVLSPLLTAIPSLPTSSLLWKPMEVLCPVPLCPTISRVLEIPHLSPLLFRCPSPLSQPHFRWYLPGADIRPAPLHSISPGWVTSHLDRSALPLLRERSPGSAPSFIFRHNCRNRRHNYEDRCLCHLQK